MKVLSSILEKWVDRIAFQKRFVWLWSKDSNGEFWKWNWSALTPFQICWVNSCNRIKRDWINKRPQHTKRILIWLFIESFNNIWLLFCLLLIQPFVTEIIYILLFIAVQGYGRGWALIKISNSPYLCPCHKAAFR